jgi:hypothetical protein
VDDADGAFLLLLDIRKTIPTTARRTKRSARAESTIKTRSSTCPAKHDRGLGGIIESRSRNTHARSHCALVGVHAPSFSNLMNEGVARDLNIVPRGSGRSSRRSQELSAQRGSHPLQARSSRRSTPKIEIAELAEQSEDRIAADHFEKRYSDRTA